MTVVVHDARPPLAVVRILNPVMRILLRTPLARAIGGLALLEFAGRRSGQRYRVPVGWYRAGERELVFTPAKWRANFEQRTHVVVRHRGRKRTMAATLVTDPELVASALAAVLESGTSPRAVGIDVPTGHTVSARDVALLDRALIVFDTASS